MKKASHLNVKFANSDSLERGTFLNIFWLYIRRRNHLDKKYVIHYFRKMNPWKDILFMKEKIHLDVNIAIINFQTTSVNMTDGMKRRGISKPFHWNRDKSFWNQFVCRCQNVNAVLLPAYLCWNLKINLLILIPVQHIIAYNPGPGLYFLQLSWKMSNYVFLFTFFRQNLFFGNFLLFHYNHTCNCSR